MRSNLPYKRCSERKNESASSYRGVNSLIRHAKELGMDPGELLSVQHASNPVEEYLAGQLSEQTRRVYRGDLNTFLLFLANPKAFRQPEELIKTLLAVDSRVAVVYRNEMMEWGYAPSTIARKISVISNIYDALRAEGWIERNPFERVKRPRVSNEGRTAALTREQAELLLSLPDVSTRIGMRDKVLLLLMLYCGLRRGEVVKIQRKDFYEDQEFILLKVHGKGRSGKVDRVKVPVVVWGVVKKYMDKYAITSEEYLFTGQGYNPQYNKTHKPISTNRVYLLVKSYCSKAGLDPKCFSPHSLRATAITLALDGGASVRQVQSMARHHDPKTTIRYDRHLHNLQDNAVDYINLDNSSKE